MTPSQLLKTNDETKVAIKSNLESNVVSYMQTFPFQFQLATNSTLTTSSGENFIDFFSGAGAINFGHNNPFIKQKILDYLMEDNIIHGLDMSTVARKEFFSVFEQTILLPKELEYKIMSCGPTGTNAVEASLKLARKVKNRKNIFAFTGAFHGMSLGALALTSDSTSRNGAGVPLDNVTRIPFPSNNFSKRESIKYIRHLLEDDHSGTELPAAMILETVQGEGGVNIASVEWLQDLRRICDEFDILLLIDDIQAGVGRTGDFFSFERANIKPDMVMLSKSISGFGLPMSLLLFKPELDFFSPGEHNGTFRGNQLAFVGSTAAIEFYTQNRLDEKAKSNGLVINNYFQSEICTIAPKLKVRGLGMIWGIDFSDIDPRIAVDVQAECIKHGLIIELAGSQNSVLKILPPLTIPINQLYEGLEIIKNSIKSILTS